MRKRYAIICAGACLAAIILVPLNMLLISFPEWTAIVAAVAAALLYILFLVKGKTGIISRIGLGVLTAVTIVFVLFASYCNPFWNSVSFREKPRTLAGDTVISADAAVSDMDFMMKYLEKVHPLCYDGAPEKTRREYEAQREKLKSGGDTTVFELYRGCESVAATLSDGHTAIYDRFKGNRYLPYDCENLVMVNGRTIEEIFGENESLFSYETREYGIHLLRKTLLDLHGAELLGTDLSSGAEYTFLIGGEEKTITVTEADFVPYSELKKDDRAFWYAIDEANGTAVFTLNSCDFNDDYKQTLRDMFGEIKEKGIEKLIVDLRENGGGSSLTAEEFIRYFDVNSYLAAPEIWRFGKFSIQIGNAVKTNKRYSDLLFGGKLFVLTSVETYSSAMQFAEYIADNDLGTVVGETSGNLREHNGETVDFVLPNSLLYFQVSSARQLAADTTSEGKQVTPDIECKADSALESIL